MCNLFLTVSVVEGSYIVVLPWKAGVPNRYLAITRVILCFQACESDVESGRVYWLATLETLSVFEAGGSRWEQHLC